MNITEFVRSTRKSFDKSGLFSATASYAKKDRHKMPYLYAECNFDYGCI